MDATRWRRIKRLFSGVLELPPDRRAPWLAEALPDSPTLAEEIRDLAAAHDGEGEILEAGALAAAPDLAASPALSILGRRIGPYRLLSELGRGGMGAVYLAVRDDPAFVQRVALKLIQRGLDSEEIVRRFVHERQILAGLSHPYIARLLDGGTDEDGRPYFVMEHVEGVRITDHAAANRLGLEARLRLLLKVCAAVQYAHQNLVVHRDLKPGNLLVDRDGTPKLLDFGIAKLLEVSDPAGLTLPTAPHQQPMTPEYASPEQLEGRPITTATDVYGLGALLYELLVGMSPRGVERRLGPGWADRPASQAVRALIARGEAEERRPPDGGPRRLAGDLDTILSKALEAEPARRYPTAAALADDLERALDRRPVAARRPSFFYRASRTIARHKLATALVLALVVLAVGAVFSALEIARGRDRAEAQRNRATALAGFLADLFRSIDPEESRGRQVTARQILDHGASSLVVEGNLPLPAETRAGLLSEVGKVYASFGANRDAHRLLDRARSLRCPGEGNEGELACAEILTRLANVALDESSYAESRQLYLRALVIKRRILGAKNPATIDDLNRLGRVATETGELDRAGDYLREAGTIARASLKAETATSPERRIAEGRLAENHFHLGNLVAILGRTAEADRHARDAVRLYRSAFGDDYPETVLARGDLAVSLYSQGEYQEAEALFRQILASHRRLLGPDHPDIALTLANLGGVEEAEGKLGPAEAHLRESLAMRERLGNSDVDRAKAINSLAAILRQKGDLAESERLYTRALSEFRRLSGAGHSDVANVIDGLARIHLDRGDLAEAERMARQSLEVFERAFGAEHSRVGSSWSLLAETLEREGRLAEAEEGYRRALSIARKTSPKGHPRIARSAIGLGDVLLRRGRADQAEPLLVEGLRILRRVRPVGDERIASAEGLLGDCYFRLGRAPAARPLLAASYRVLRALHGPDHPAVREAEARLRRLAAAP
ncbi:MAG TPA: serine/threonine-protein kinase [Thermoanaerobaculia bacterium]|jgi:serine/threonine-protein kinase|nr:serine/threonine-protein kinase [Thermoanaerobaculia bacterium]